MSDDTQSATPAYGQDDASFQAAGGETGLRKLIECFYGLMAGNPRYQRILEMHPGDVELSVDKLSRFLCGWLGGPKLFNEKYGQIKLPSAHKHLAITDQDKEDWLRCMQMALDEQDYAPDFKQYLMEQLRRPAERIVVVCENMGRQPE